MKKYEKNLLTGDFNVALAEPNKATFWNEYKLKVFNKEPTFSKNYTSPSCRGLYLKNCPKSFECMLLSCHVSVSKWTYTLYTFLFNNKHFYKKNEILFSTRFSTTVCLRYYSLFVHWTRCKLSFDPLWTIY